MDELTRDQLNELCEAEEDGYCQVGDDCVSCEAGMQIHYQSTRKKPCRADKINSGFELAGGFFLLLSIIQVVLDKSVAGVNPIHVGFFGIWGYWNLYYYRSIQQPWSFATSIFVTAANTVWLGLLLYYRG
jgi:hypothetical protein